MCVCVTGMCALCKRVFFYAIILLLPVGDSEIRGQLHLQRTATAECAAFVYSRICHDDQSALLGLLIRAAPADKCGYVCMWLIVCSVEINPTFRQRESCPNCLLSFIEIPTLLHTHIYKHTHTQKRFGLQVIGT